MEAMTPLLWVFLNMKPDLQYPLCRDVHYGMEVAVIEGYLDPGTAIQVLKNCEDKRPVF